MKNNEVELCDHDFKPRGKTFLHCKKCGVVRKKPLTEDTLKAGVIVKYKDKEYTTGNRRLDEVELYEGFKFYKVVNINQIEIL